MTTSGPEPGPGPRRRRSAPVDPVSRGADAQVRSVQTAMRILDHFHDHEELGPTELAPAMGISNSSACRILITMAGEGFLERTDAGRYRLGLRMMTLGNLSLSRFRLRDLALPLITEVRDSLDETCQIGVPLGGDVLYLDRLESRSALWLHSEEYRRMPGATSATGRAIAAFNPSFRQAVEAGGLQPRRLTPNTITDPDRFRAELDKVRRQGWACLREESVIGISAIAAPVLLHTDTEPTAVAAISVVGSSSRVIGRKNIVRKAVLEAAQQLASRVGRQYSEQGWGA